MKRAALLMLALSAAAYAKPALNADGTRIENAFRGALQDRSAKSPGEALFVEKCGMCHRQMGMGTVILARRMDPGQARLEVRRDLTPELIVAAARQGIGNMPRISRAEASDAQLATISSYLTARKPADAPNE